MGVSLTIYPSHDKKLDGDSEIDKSLHPDTTLVSVQANVVNFAMMHDHVVGGKYPIWDYIYITKLNEQLTITFFFK